MANLVVARGVEPGKACYACENTFTDANPPMTHEGDLGDKHEFMHEQCWRQWMIRKTTCPLCQAAINPSRFNISWIERLQALSSEVKGAFWEFSRPYIDVGRRLRHQRKEMSRVFLVNGAIAGVTALASQALGVMPLMAAVSMQLGAQLPKIPVKWLIGGTLSFLAMSSAEPQGLAIAIGMNAAQVAKKIDGANIESIGIGFIAAASTVNYLGLRALSASLFYGAYAGIVSTWQYLT